MSRFFVLPLLLCTGCGGPMTAVTAPQQRTSVTARAPDPCAIVVTALSCAPTSEQSRRSSTGDDGILTCETICESDGTPEGPYQSVRFDDPPVVTIGAHFRGRRTGPWEAHIGSPDGPLRELTTYLNGPRVGPYRSFHPDGSPHISGSYARERKDGIWLQSSADGVVLSEETYASGKRIGVHRTRYPDGAIAFEHVYDDQGRPDGTWCAWLADGTAIGCTEFDDGNGTAKQYNDRGQLTLETGYFEGERHGKERIIDGERVIETTWSHGHETGLQREIASGCVEVERTLVDGRANGPFTRRVCAPSGDIDVEVGTYCNDAFCQLWVERSPETGGIVRIAEYDQLSMKLAEATFDAAGKLSEFWTMDDRLKLPRAACYQAIAGGLCCEIVGDSYNVSVDCLHAVDTTEL